MKKHVLMVLTTMSLFFTMAAASISAQSDTRLVVTIPFEFSIRNKVLPAGEYIVSQIARDTLMIRRVDCSASETFFTNPIQAHSTPNQSTLVFNRYGKQYFLAKIWKIGNDTGSELSKPRAERKLVRARITSAYDASDLQIVSVSAHLK
jgi:hypothetical protein